MQRSAKPVDLRMECRLRLSLNKVMARTVEGFAPADLEPCATRRDQPVGLGDGEHRVGADHGHNIIIGQSLALIDIEHHKALEESDLPGLAILSPRLLRFRSEEHTSELQSLMRISYAVSCLKNKRTIHPIHIIIQDTQHN